MATASLHNLAVMWNKPLLDDDNEEGEPEDDQEDGEEGEGITGSIRRVRMEGEVLRNTLVQNMPGPSAIERGRISQRI